MAKRIIIAFNSQPVEGLGFSYNIFIDGVKMVFDSGFTNLNTSYVTNNTPSVEPLYLEIQDTLNETINFTLSILKGYWTADNVTYKRVNDTIEMLISGELITVSTEGVNPSITSTVIDVPESENIGLRYFFQYTGVQGDVFLCQIYKKNYVGVSTEIHGTANIDKGSVKDHLDSIRGTGLSLELEASLDVTLEDLYTENEQDFTIKFYRNNKIAFRGFLKPDGVFQSFVRDIWIISLDCVDGLGALSNLSFVKPTGLRFIGKMKASDIVYFCLKRTGIALPINVSINTLYEGLTPTTNLDILTKIKMNADRFFKNDNETLMSCEEVLKSVLDVFCAVITQENGEWYIYKPNEIYFEPYVLFRRYDINNMYAGNVTINTNKVLGSQIDNFYPHHCSGNQKIEIKGGISAFRLGYKYGFVSGLLVNPSLTHDASLNYQGWTVIDGFNLVNDPLKDSGFVIKNSTFGVTSNMVKSDPLATITEDLLILKMSFDVRGGDGNPASRFVKFRIQQGIYYLKYSPKNSGSSFDDAAQLASWTTNASDTYTINISNSGSFEIALPKMLADGNLTIAIIQTYPSLGLTTISSLDIVPNTGNKAEQGEFHTVSRKTKVSSIIKENKTVYNGDNAGIIYLGAIFKEDGITTTEKWFRKTKIESFPLLRIAAEEEIRIAQKPLKVFRGSAFGFIPYLSLIDVNEVGKFMPIEYSYDTARNITNLKLLELYSPEISDILYKFAYDYGNTVKPTITG